MLGGVLWPLWVVIHLSVGSGEPGSAAYERYEFVNRLLPLTLLPVVVGFIELHAAQRSSHGRLGAAGFATVLVGFMLMIAGSVSEFWLFSDQPYMLPNGRQASFNLFLLGHLPLGIGTLLFGIATVRAKVFPYKAAVMLVLPGAAVVVPFVGAFVFAIPFVWLGYLLWSGSVQQTSRVT
jgi:uncharacterized membrane protein YedE/YeeE